LPYCNKSESALPIESVDVLRKRLIDVQWLILHLARLIWVRVLLCPRYEDKVVLTSQVVELFGLASLLEYHLFNRFHRGRRALHWDQALSPLLKKIFQETTVDASLLSNVIASAHGQLKRALDALYRDISSIRSLNSWSDLVTQIASSTSLDCPQTDFRIPRLQPSPKPFRRKALKVLIGPLSSGFHPALVPLYSMLDFAAPAWSNQITGAIPYFWTLSTREAMACDACILSGIEYDGLPLDFYYDMARQAADEARHALMFFELAVELMPEYLRAADPSHKAFNFIAGYLEGTGKLPVPIEGGLFDAMWNSILQERLILMQIDTEGPAVARARKAAQSPLASSFPKVRLAYEVDCYDEIAHTRIGHRWLKYLVPSKGDRELLIQNTRKLRPFVLLTCFCRDRRHELAELIARFVDGARVPTKDFFSR
jgi:hypothetical protein